MQDWKLQERQKNYSTLTEFMYRFLLILILLPLQIFAQDSTSYSEFRFTLTEANGRDITNDAVQAVITDVFINDTLNKDLDYVFTKLEYSVKDSCWILSQNEPHGYNYTIDIYRKSDTVNQKLLDLRKMTLIFNGYDPATKTGCQYCLCNDIPFTPGKFGIDIPRRVESWLYIRKVSINIKGIPTEFRDVSAIQNWFFRN